MFDLNPLTAISREVREWIDTLDKKREAQNQATAAALRTLSLAVLETRSYIGLMSNKAERDLPRERELSQLWNDAQTQLRLIDASLAGRCFAKAEHWADPTRWDAAKVRQYNITLDSMSDSVRHFLTTQH
jgi:hypothetical protein